MNSFWCSILRKPSLALHDTRSNITWSNSRRVELPQIPPDSKHLLFVVKINIRQLRTFICIYTFCSCHLYSFLMSDFRIVFATATTQHHNNRDVSECYLAPAPDTCPCTLWSSHHKIIISDVSNIIYSPVSALWSDGDNSLKTNANRWSMNNENQHCRSSFIAL